MKTNGRDGPKDTAIPEEIERAIDRIRTQPIDVLRLSEARALADANPDSGRAWFFLAQQNVKAGMRKFGLQALEHALSVDPALSNRLSSGLPEPLASVIEAMKFWSDFSRDKDADADAKQDILKRLLQRYPNFTPFLFNYAVLIATREPEQARRLALRVIELSPTMYRSFPPAITKLVEADREATEAFRVAAAATGASAGAARVEAPAEHVHEADPYVGKTFEG